MATIPTIATMRKGEKSIRPSPGIPSPPVLSDEYLATIPAPFVRVMALTVDLHKKQSMTVCAIWFGATVRTFLKPPRHILGGHESWPAVLHAIRHYNEMSPEERDRENEVARRMTKSQIKKLKANMNRLMVDRPDPKMMPRNDGAAQQLNELTAASARRSSAAMMGAIAEDVIRKHEELHQPQRLAKRRKTACVDCGFVPHAKVLEASKCELPLDPRVCIQCVEQGKQVQKKLDKDTNLANINNQQLEQPLQCVASCRKVDVDLEAFLTYEFGPDIAKELVEMEGRSFLSLEVMDIANNHNNNKAFVEEQQSIAGAEWIPNGASEHPNTFKLKEGSRDALILNLPRSKGGNPSQRNFAVLMNNGFDQPSVDSFVGDEMDDIYAGKVGRRQGAASGVFQVGELCLSFTRVTQKCTTLYKASGKKSVHIYANYLNDSGDAKKFGGYKAMHINRLTTRQKRRIANASLAYRHILEREGLKYIISIACVAAVGIPALNSDGKYFSELKKIFVSRAENEHARDCLWKWMCSTGETRNHEACKCHVDGNRSNPYEILSLFHRPRMPKKDGFLYLPLDNACIRVKCDKQSLFSNFTCTPHAADPSRNDCNFSKVHGPRP